MARPTQTKGRCRSRTHHLPDIEDDPDFKNPKGFILTRNFQQCYGRTVREQLRSRLEMAGFTDIRLTETVRDKSGWSLVMYNGTNSDGLNTEELIRYLMRLIRDIGWKVERAGIAAVVLGERVEAAFIMSPLDDHRR